MSASPFLRLSSTPAGPATPVILTGTPRCFAIARATSAPGPRTSPVLGSIEACTGLVAM